MCDLNVLSNNSKEMQDLIVKYMKKYSDFNENSFFWNISDSLVRIMYKDLKTSKFKKIDIPINNLDEKDPEYEMYLKLKKKFENPLNENTLKSTTAIKKKKDEMSSTPKIKISDILSTPPVRSVKNEEESEELNADEDMEDEIIEDLMSEEEMEIAILNELESEDEIESESESESEELEDENTSEEIEDETEDVNIYDLLKKEMSKKTECGSEESKDVKEEEIENEAEDKADIFDKIETFNEEFEFIEPDFNKTEETIENESEFVLEENDLEEEPENIDVEVEEVEKESKKKSDNKTLESYISVFNYIKKIISPYLDSDDNSAITINTKINDLDDLVKAPFFHDSFIIELENRYNIEIDGDNLPENINDMIQYILNNSSKM